MKQQPCCARLTGQLTRAKVELHTLASRAARAEQRGRPVIGIKDKIAAQKHNVEEAERNIADHEAEHAGICA